MAEHRVFLQTVIAVIWDFDCTLIPGYMQKPLFEEYGVDEKQFWEEVNALPEIYGKKGITIAKDTAYLNHILAYVESGLFKDLTNQKLRELGAKLHFYPGMPEFLGQLKKKVADNPEFSRNEIELENYIVSTGLKPLIQGSAAQPYVDGVWACEFIEDVVRPGLGQTEMDLEHQGVSQIGYMLDNTTKTRAIFEINKGTNKNSEIDVNASIRPGQRRVPFRNMLYIADGPSDIPSFSVIHQFEGKTYAVASS